MRQYIRIDWKLDAVKLTLVTSDTVTSVCRHWNVDTIKQYHDHRLCISRDDLRHNALE